MTDLFSLENRVIAVTGGYGWLGTAVVEALADSGARVYVLGRDRRKYQAAFPDERPSVRFALCDVADSSSVQEAFEQIAGAEGRIDVLINNAFFSRGQNPECLTDEEWRYSMEGTIGTVHRGIREALPHLKASEDGRIINVSSMYGMVAPPFGIYEGNGFLNPPHYGAAKAGVIQLTKYYACYLAQYGILVNCVSPGPFPSETVQQNKEFVDRLEANVPLGRIGKPEDLRGAFIFLSSGASRFITGHNLVVDGGWTVR